MIKTLREFEDRVCHDILSNEVMKAYQVSNDLFLLLEGHPYNFRDYGAYHITLAKDIEKFNVTAITEVILREK